MLEFSAIEHPIVAVTMLEMKKGREGQSEVRDQDQRKHFFKGNFLLIKLD